MRKPEMKLIRYTTPKNIKELRENTGRINYNEACLDYEAWLREVASVEGITTILKNNTSYSATGSASKFYLKDAAKAIAKIINKEEK